MESECHEKHSWQDFIEIQDHETHGCCAGLARLRWNGTIVAAQRPIVKVWLAQTKCSSISAGACHVSGYESDFVTTKSCKRTIKR
jgi:hypothetical protein